jgi:amino acid adenylation domain-containing protein
MSESRSRLPGPGRVVCPTAPSGSFLPWGKGWTECSISDRFRQQARAHAGRLAIKGLDRELTYQALDAAANRAARAILAESGPRQEPILLLFEHGAQMAEAILGALKAAKAYVPLDPSYPVERNRFIAEDSGARLLVTNARNLGHARLLAGSRLRLIELCALDSSVPDEDPNLPSRPDDVALIHYTSGSTGRPKGVVHTHRNALHIALRHTNGQRITADDRLSLLSSYSYGASVGNLFGGLLNGSAVLTFNLKEQGVGGLARWLIAEEVTIYYSVATVFRRFAATLTGEERFPHLRLIRLGGEAIYRDDVETYKSHFDDGCLLHVGLGTTETGVVRECFFDKQTECDQHIAPVGYAVEDMDVLLLDAERRPVAPGEVGEIAVRSRYLSPGYWRRPELTSAAFFPDPDGGSRRVYLTGDLGRMLPGGCLLYAGRKDSQVKIRGYRVETAEIEAALRSAPGVREAAVTVRDDGDGEKRLLAFAVPRDGATLDAAALRSSLRDSLPDFMVPSTFVVRDDLPRTPGGKVDRDRLAALASAVRADRSGFVFPRTDVEARLALLWEEVLGAGPVGARDDFFDLGGDSLSAARLFDRVADVFGARLPASTLLECPTVEQMAGVVARGDSEGSALVPIRATGASPFFCAHGIGGDVISFHGLARHLGDDLPFVAVRARDGDTDRFSVEGIAAHYLSEIRRVQPDGPYFLGGYSFGGTVAFEMARQLVAGGEAVGLLALFDTYGPGYPELLPAWRRLVMHGRNVLRAGPAERRRYLRERARINLVRVRKAARRATYVGSMRARGKPPEGMRNNLEAAHEQALRNYVPAPYGGELDLFTAADRPETWCRDPHLGWGGLAAGGVRVHDVPGDHITLLAEPNVRALAGALGARLREARRAGSSYRRGGNLR